MMTNRELQEAVDELEERKTEFVGLDDDTLKKLVAILMTARHRKLRIKDSTIERAQTELSKRQTKNWKI